METYVVGGAVRDRLLGLPVQDRDHVVVGATPEAMLARGFKPKFNRMEVYGLCRRCRGPVSEDED